MTDKPIELYIWPTPNAWKVSIALEEMELPYVVKYVHIGKGEQFTPEFLKISPNNRMPAIIDPEGPDGAPISVFESGAILQYLARKSGKFYGNNERERVAVEEWLMWQMGGLGPMSGQASHFRNYAPALVDDPKLIEYGRNRYFNETNRLFGVMNKRLAEVPYLAGDYSIADMACFPWVRAFEFIGQDLDDFPVLKAWVDKLSAREAVARGMEVGREMRVDQTKLSDEQKKEQAKALFNQSAKDLK
ncbi:MAG: glutathione S-transferase [Hyphomonadaceae bacterium]|nr:MAG: glutathione S-transferase [Hyphomonadaceae bacterium]KAF0186067.1 MAG: glutathione S-transferase [Hyphomonadaceae bacterium]